MLRIVKLQLPGGSTHDACSLRVIARSVKIELFQCAWGTMLSAWVETVETGVGVVDADPASPRKKAVPRGRNA